MTLRHGEWQLSYPGTTFTFGTPETPVWNRTTPDVGDVDIRVADGDRPRQDGRAFGVDFRGARTISFDLGVRAHTAAEVREETAELLRAWRADAIRGVPGAVASLTSHYDGRERVVYGRPRRIAPNYSDVTVNLNAVVVADFACVDDLFYGTTEESHSFSIVPGTGGGLEAPLASPLSTTADSDRSMGINVRSELPVWPIIRVEGPISNAVVTVGNFIRWEIRLDLNLGEWVTIDTRPWKRSAMRNDTAPVTGTVRGTRLAASAIPPGAHEVGLQGQDPTGTARIEIAWTSAYSSP